MKKWQARIFVKVNTNIIFINERFLLELYWNYELLYNNSSVVVINKKKGNIYACKFHIF